MNIKTTKLYYHGEEVQISCTNEDCYGNVSYIIHRIGETKPIDGKVYKSHTQVLDSLDILVEETNEVKKEEEIKKCMNEFEKAMKSIKLNPFAKTMRIKNFKNIWETSWFKALELKDINS